MYNILFTLFIFTNNASASDCDQLVGGPPAELQACVLEQLDRHENWLSDLNDLFWLQDGDIDDLDGRLINLEHAFYEFRDRVTVVLGHLWNGTGGTPTTDIVLSFVDTGELTVWPGHPGFAAFNFRVDGHSDEVNADRVTFQLEGIDLCDNGVPVFDDITIVNTGGVVIADAPDYTNQCNPHSPTNFVQVLVEDDWTIHAGEHNFALNLGVAPIVSSGLNVRVTMTTAVPTSYHFTQDGDILTVGPGQNLVGNEHEIQ